MKARELLKEKVEEEIFDVDPFFGFSYSHIGDIERYDIDLLACSEDNNKKKFIKISKLAYFDFDGRRIWSMHYASWKSGLEEEYTPFIIFANAGREGDDSYYRVIINKEKYLLAKTYIKSFVSKDFTNEYEGDLGDLDSEIITEFYGGSLKAYQNKQMERHT
jgi:hypothetical protein